LKRFRLDVAFLQVSCSTYPLLGKHGMDLEDAALLAAEVGPSLVIPIHYQARGKVLQDNVLEAWKPEVPVMVLKPGVPLEL
jgi:L-ascorbate metabolism protein UlaG (beta-lactamase superfamily)